MGNKNAPYGTLLAGIAKTALVIIALFLLSTLVGAIDMGLVL